MMVAARLMLRIGFVLPMACRVVIRRRLWAGEDDRYSKYGKGDCLS
jgi:hypothetical protein